MTPDSSSKAVALCCAILLSLALHSPAIAQTVRVSPNAVLEGGTTTASWSGFGGNVNVEVWNFGLDSTPQTTRGIESGPGPESRHRIN